jgi:DNA-binding NarL/FixJ family response regulator
VKTISVFVCESQPIVIEGLKRVLEGCSDLKLAGETSNPEDTADLVAALRPDVALIDQSWGSRTALELVARVRAASEFTQAVLWVTSLTEGESFRALQTGARGILKKTLPVASVQECLRAVGQGNIWIENSISNQMVGFLNRRDVPRLTAREHEVVELVCRGMKNKQIADTLAITTGTVKVHLMHIFEKTGVKDRFELAMEARKFLGISADSEVPVFRSGEPR